MTAPAKPAGRPEPVAWMATFPADHDCPLKPGSWRSAVCFSIQKPDATNATPLYGPDLLDYADRMRAERDAANDEIVRLNKWADSFTDSHLKERKTGDALVKEVLQRADAAARQLAELQRKHDGLVARLREPSNDLLSAMMYAWENSFGTPFTRYKTMLNAAVDIAMSAVALQDEKGGS